MAESVAGRVAVTCGAVVLMASLARAQDIPSSFDQLRVVVRAGDVITVTGNLGGVTQGRILDLSPVALGLQVDGQRRELSMDDVRTITQYRHANLATGAKWGFGVGVGLVALPWLINGHPVEDLSQFFVIGAVYGAIGAGIGVGVAATTDSEHVIFSRPGASARMSVRPMIGGGRKGVLLTARW